MAAIFIGWRYRWYFGVLSLVPLGVVLVVACFLLKLAYLFVTLKLLR